MERPPSRIIRVESNGHGRFWRNQHGIPHGASESVAVDRDDLERMTMQMHGMRHHGLIDEHKLHPFALGDHEGRDILVPGHIVDGPLVALHRSRQIDRVRPVRLAIRQWLDGSQ